MRSIHAISDIHGCIEPLRAALDIVNLDGDPDASLVLLGDYVDRGADSCGVLELIRETQQQHGERVVALLGNHDEWLLEWLDNEYEDSDWLANDPALVTIASFVTQEVIAAIPKTATGAEIDDLLRNEVLERHVELINWLRGLPLIHETNAQIFVHAGVDELAGSYWRAATPDYWLTNKYPATLGPFIKTIIAGHVRTTGLHEDGSNSVYHDGESHYYIDGAVEITRRLNVLRYEVESGIYSWRMTPELES